MFDITPFGYRPTNIFKAFDDFEKNFFSDFDEGFKAFKTDIEDVGDKFLLSAELPGFNKEDINIDIDDNMLTIRAEQKQENDEKDNKGNYIRRERSYGCYQRSFDISNVKAENISAEYKNGVLQLALPKQEEKKANQLKIDIN